MARYFKGYLARFIKLLLYARKNSTKSDDERPRWEIRDETKSKATFPRVLARNVSSSPTVPLISARLPFKSQTVAVKYLDDVLFIAEIVSRELRNDDVRFFRAFFFYNNFRDHLRILRAR